MWSTFDLRRAVYDVMFPSLSVSITSLENLLEPYGFGIMDVEDLARDGNILLHDGIAELKCGWTALVGDEWIATATGGIFWPFAPRMRDIHIADIAISLGRIQRFGGHYGQSLQYLSVAEHSVSVLNDIRRRYPKECRASPNMEMLALLHDCGEYVTGDQLRPLKHRSGDLPKAESTIRNLALTKFGARAIASEWAIVKESDTAALWSEIQSAIENKEMFPWRFAESETRAFQGGAPKNWNPEYASEMFLASFQEIHTRLLTSRGA